jgi:ubiquinone/menaquinone biosynthesis C-methylase UbiE
MEKPKTREVNGRLWGVRAKDWADIQEGQFRAAYVAVFDALALGVGTNYCDVGCGSGMAALIAAERGARVSGLDAAENLLAVARGRVPEGDFRSGEMEDPSFPDSTFDLVTGFNAFQYASNPIAALTQARRSVRTDGRVVVMTWGSPDGMPAASLLAALKPLLPPPPPGAPGPFALSDEKALREFASSAGLNALQVEVVGCEWFYADLSTALRGLGSSGVAVRAMENSSAAAVDEAHSAALAPFRQSDGSYRIGATFQWLAASP